jgi:hypothetical protein
MRKQRWSDLSRRQRTGVVLGASAQLSLAAAAWIDLAMRPASQVQGSKAKWAAIIAVNWVGPLAYFRWGRRASGSPLR